MSTCPFPGMDPYIERPAIWPDFHDSLIAAIRGLLQPLLRPKYAALTQDRLYVVEADRTRLPDVAVIHAPSRERSPTAVLEAEPDSPTVFELVRDEMREPFIQIIEPAAGNRLITAIEVLSPDNKQAGAGRKSYLEKREEYFDGGANLVEIDLLRSGTSTVRIPLERLAALSPWRYLVGVTRQHPFRQEIYHFPLAQRLPRIRVPLTREDRDPVLDLQAAFTRAWEEGPYPAVLFYDQPPPGDMSAAELAWCRERIAVAGIQ